MIARCLPVDNLAHLHIPVPESGGDYTIRVHALNRGFKDLADFARQQAARKKK